MNMINMNWLNFISFVCSIIEYVYILLVINFFVKFVWAKEYQFHKTFEIMNILKNVITFIIDWSKKIYTNNDFHFVNNDVIIVLKSHEINHFTKSINHSFSTKLLKRTMQKLLFMLIKKCIERDTINSWKLFLRDYVLVMNIKTIKIHNYKFV